MSYITCKDLAVGYDGRAVASGLNFSIDKGDYLCIVGENGAGKSTLVKTLLGLLKPVSGEIKFGDDLTSRDIGYLPQESVGRAAAASPFGKSSVRGGEARSAR